MQPDAEPVTTDVHHDPWGEDVRTSIACHASALIGRYGYHAQDRSDLEMDILIELQPRLQAFNPAKGAWSTHVARSIGKTIVDLLRARCAKRRTVPGPAQPLMPLHEVISVSVDGEASVLADRPSTQDLDIDQADALARLTPFQRQVCLALRSDNPNATAKVLGVSRHRVRFAMRQIRQVFQRLGLHTYMDASTCSVATFEVFSACNPMR